MRGDGATVDGAGATLLGEGEGETIRGAGELTTGVLGRAKSRRDGAGSGERDGVLKFGDPGSGVTRDGGSICRRADGFTMRDSPARVAARGAAGVVVTCGADPMPGVDVDGAGPPLTGAGIDVIGRGPPVVGDGIVVDGAAVPLTWRLEGSGVRVIARSPRLAGFTACGSLDGVGAARPERVDGRVATCGRELTISREPPARRDGSTADG